MCTPLNLQYMHSKDTNTIKLTPVLQLQKTNNASKSSTLFAPRNKTKDIVERFRREKSHARKRQSLFSGKGATGLESSGLFSRAKAASLVPVAGNLAAVVQEPDLEASAILQSFFEAVRPDNGAVTQRRSDVLLVASLIFR